MTYEEVKRIFRMQFLGTCCIDFENGDGTNECAMPNSNCDDCKIAEAERMILEALDKQIPQKPNKAIDSAWGIEKEVNVCPCCDYYLGNYAFIPCETGFNGGVVYCEVCGQANLLEEVE